MSPLYRVELGLSTVTSEKVGERGDNRYADDRTHEYDKDLTEDVL